MAPTAETAILDSSELEVEHTVSRVLDTPSVASILHGLQKRGLSICLNSEGDGLRLSGPQAARTEKVKATLKAAKAALVAYLREQQKQEEKVEPPADLVASFGEELVQEGHQVEADLMRQHVGASDCRSDESGSSGFLLPEIIYHEDPAEFWRQWRQT